MKILSQLIIISFLFTSTGFCVAKELRIAVASNFTTTVKLLTQKFEEKTQHSSKLIFGASGRHYAQIRNGAPFDIFLSADSERPKRLEQENLIVENSRFTYAIGKLVLWSLDSQLINQDSKALFQNNFSHLAIANHKLAPYGKAAYQVLNQLDLWKSIKSKTVRGENIAQTFQFVRSKNAELGFVALSQVKALSQIPQGSMWVVPDILYTPIKQQAVLLKESNVANNFIRFLQSDEAKKIIQNAGYGLPHD